MEIIKKINNNIALARDAKGREWCSARDWDSLQRPISCRI